MTETTDTGAMQVDIDLVRQLAELLDASALTEIEVEDGPRKIRVARKAGAGTAPAPYHPPQQAAPAAASIEVVAAPTPAPRIDAVKSPMVGTAYLSAEPGSRPFVGPGQPVKAGDTLLIVEAMKVMNPILAPSAGTVREVLVDNGQPVEFDQPLVVVE